MIPEKQKKVINQIRKIYEDAGCNLYTDALRGWPSMNQYHGTTDGTWQIKTYGHDVTELKTPDGSHPVLGSHSFGKDIESPFIKVKEIFGLVHLSSPVGAGGEKWDLWKITRFPE